VQFNRFLEVGESLVLGLALAGDVEFEALGDIPLPFAPNSGRKWPFHVLIVSQARSGRHGGPPTSRRVRRPSARVGRPAMPPNVMGPNVGQDSSPAAGLAQKMHVVLRVLEDPRRTGVLPHSALSTVPHSPFISKCLVADRRVSISTEQKNPLNTDEFQPQCRFYTVEGQDD